MPYIPFPEMNLTAELCFFLCFAFFFFFLFSMRGDSVELQNVEGRSPLKLSAISQGQVK